MTILREFLNIFISDVVTSNCFFCVVNPVLSSTCLKLYWACAITGGPSHFGAPHGTGVFEAAPDLISYNSAISACEAAGEWENTLALLEELIEIGQDTPRVYLGVQMALEAAELQPDVICYSGVISACAKGGFWRLTIMLLERLSAQRMHPDLVALNSALGAYKGPRWQMAISTLSSLPTLRLMPDVVSFCTAISCCAEVWPKALQLLTMRSLHARLAQDVFGCLVGGLLTKTEGNRKVTLQHQRLVRLQTC
ncbi:unnamed protein product [Cladocopium goreaui]|uniref:Pentatricopeptide repeat-containing protein n=1 Tax=Cladocopium goreaui TaxID=2562237 RepID=A0A9P1DT29_9DINO|nr:unnamed protein product [Cladocopium goreaui]